MLATLLLLGLLYVALVAVLGAAGVGTAVTLVVVAGLALAQLFLSDKLALRVMSAHEVAPQEAPGLHAVVERLCIQADLPKPKVALAETPMPNAIRSGSLTEDCHRLCDHGPPRHPRAGRARGRHHPPLERRVAQLERLEIELQGGPA